MMQDLETAIDRMIDAQKALYGADGYLYAVANLTGLLKGCAHSLSDGVVEAMVHLLNNRAEQAEQDLVIQTLKAKGETA